MYSKCNLFYQLSIFLEKYLIASFYEKAQKMSCLVSGLRGAWNGTLYAVRLIGLDDRQAGAVWPVMGKISNSSVLLAQRR